MKTIGFTEVYYTLWEVGEPYTESFYYNGIKVGEVTKQNTVFCQNLSHDLERAKAKLAGQEFNINLELRGHGSFTAILGSTVKDRENYYPHTCFSFGRLEGSEISEATDLWQIRRAFHEERSPRRRAVARRRLITLGELVVFRHTIVSDFDENETPITKNIKYTSPEQAKYLALQNRKKAMSGHHFNNGEKVTLEVIEIERFKFAGRFGTTFVRTFETRCGKIVKYMGSSPVDLISQETFELIDRYETLKKLLFSSDEPFSIMRNALSDEEFDAYYKEQDDLYVEIDKQKKGFSDWCKITATVKHDTYKEAAETKLLRIKVLKE